MQDVRLRDGSFYAHLDNQYVRALIGHKFGDVWVISRASDRPCNAIPECGVAWLPMADVGDGTGEPDLTILLMRQMLGAGEFKNALHNILKQEDIAAGMGPYLPRGRYMSVAAFETARPCLIEKR